MERCAVVPVARAADLPLDVTIDGNLDEWGDAKSFGAEAALLHQGLWPAGDGAYRWSIAPDPEGAAQPRTYDAAAVRLACDDQFIYLAVRVVDQSVVPAAPDQSIESGDGFGAMLDFRAFDGEGDNRFGAWNPWTDSVPQAVFGFTAGPDQNGGTRTGPVSFTRPIVGLECATHWRDFGWELEARIPITNLTLNRGMEARVTAERLTHLFGVSFGFSDRDAAGPTAPAFMTPGPWTATMPLGASLLPPKRSPRRFLAA